MMDTMLKKPAPSGGEEKKRSRMFVPVTVKMIHDALPCPDDAFEIDGASVNDVSFQSLSPDLGHFGR